MARIVRLGREFYESLSPVNRFDLHRIPNPTVKSASLNVTGSEETSGFFDSRSLSSCAAYRVSRFADSPRVSIQILRERHGIERDPLYA